MTAAIVAAAARVTCGDNVRAQDVGVSPGAAPRVTSDEAAWRCKRQNDRQGAKRPRLFRTRGAPSAILTGAAPWTAATEDAWRPAARGAPGFPLTFYGMGPTLSQRHPRGTNLEAPMSNLERDVFLLKLYAAAATFVCSALLLTGFRSAPQERTKFTEIDVERINVVEKDGRLRLVISNRERQHHGVVDGVTLPRPNGRPPGIIFFNHQGNEAGGLVVDENGGQGHFLSLTFDKSRQDQTIGLQHLESDNGSYFAGVKIWDRPHNSLADVVRMYERVQQMPDGTARSAAMDTVRAQAFGPERIIIGRQRDRSATIELADAQGKPRIRLLVSDVGNPRLEFLDANGAVVESLPRP